MMSKIASGVETGWIPDVYVIEIGALVNARRELMNWQILGGTYFMAQLFKLCAKADQLNFSRLYVGFPAHVTAWDEWASSEDVDLLFKIWRNPDADKFMHL